MTRPNPARPAPEPARPRRHSGPQPAQHPIHDPINIKIGHIKISSAPTRGFGSDALVRTQTRTPEPHAASGTASGADGTVVGSHIHSSSGRQPGASKACSCKRDLFG